ncbi:MAG: endolytic transglycosylase MltG, partial [Ignavibacteria bacterium]
PYMNRGYMVTIPEGLNISQIARLLNRYIIIDSAKFVNETFNDSLIKVLGVDAINLEGFLFPDTYQFSFSGDFTREKVIVKIMFEQFRKKFNAEMYKEMKSKKMKLKDVITMASIIEGETRHLPEMKTISGVYYNRLRKGMRLEADPTVQYALPNGPKRRLTYNDLKYPSPYNTYLNRGLPPGPINNPGLNSITAALHPEKHKYLYFVAKGDGTHKFAESYDEHKKNVEEYRKLQEEAEEKRSEP